MQEAIMRVHGYGSATEQRPAQLISTAGSTDWISRAWWKSCIVGTLLAVTVSALVSVVVSLYLAEFRSGIYSVAAVELVAIAAVFEGALIGYFQWRVLRRVFPTMSSATWVGATMIAAAFGCVLSWVPTSFALTAAAAAKFGDVTLSFPAIARITLETGALVGLVWGVAQYAVLRLHAHQARGWILTNTLAWTATFMSLYFAAFLPDRTTSPAFHIILAAIAGVILGSFLGLLNGYVLVRLRSRLLDPSSPR
jgi:hypothetical protein